MFPFHILGTLTLQFIALTGVFFFKAHIQRHELDKRFQRVGRFLNIAIHVLIVLTIAQAVIYHILHGFPLWHNSLKMTNH